MIILHNSNDRDSRLFVEQALSENPGIEIVDWYDRKRLRQWCASGSPLQVSAFPSVLLYLDDQVGDGHYVSRKPASVQAAVVEKKVHEAKLLIVQGRLDDAQAWLDELELAGYDTTDLQDWLDSV